MNFNFFKIADRSLIDWMSKNSQSIDISKGDYLIMENELLNSLYILVSGNLEVIKSKKESVPLILSVLKEGAMIGEMSFIEENLPVASVISSSDCKILKIDFQLLRKEFKINKILSRSFYKLVSTKLCNQLLSQNKLIGYSHSTYDAEKEPLRKFIALFSSLNEVDIDWIKNHGKLISIEKKDFLIYQGEILNYVYLVLSGRGDVLLNTDEQNQIVGVSKRGELLGETSMLVEEQISASASVRASTQMDLLAISRKNLSKKINDDYDFANRFYKGISIMLSQRSRDQLENISMEFKSPKDNTYENEIDNMDEINLDLMSSISKASKHFDRLCTQIYST